MKIPPYPLFSSDYKDLFNDKSLLPEYFRADFCFQYYHKCLPQNKYEKQISQPFHAQKSPAGQETAFLSGGGFV